MSYDHCCCGRNAPDIRKESEREQPSAFQRDFHRRAQASRDLVEAVELLGQQRQRARPIVRVGQPEVIDMRPAIVCGAVLLGFMVGLLIGMAVWG